MISDCINPLFFSCFRPASGEAYMACRSSKWAGRQAGGLISLYLIPIHYAFSCSLRGFLILHETKERGAFRVPSAYSYGGKAATRLMRLTNAFIHLPQAKSCQKSGCLSDFGFAS